MSTALPPELQQRVDRVLALRGVDLRDAPEVDAVTDAVYARQGRSQLHAQLRAVRQRYEQEILTRMLSQALSGDIKLLDALALTYQYDRWVILDTGHEPLDDYSRLRYHVDITICEPELVQVRECLRQAYENHTDVVDVTTAYWAHVLKRAKQRVPWALEALVEYGMQGDEFPWMDSPHHLRQLVDIFMNEYLRYRPHTNS